PASEVWRPGYRAKVVTDALIVAFAAGYTVLASDLGLGDSSRPGPGFFPLLVGIVLMLAAGLHLVTLVLRQLRVPADAGAGRPSVHAGLMLTALAVYLVTLPLLGHLLAATIMSAAVLKLLGKRRTWVILAIAVAIGLLSDLLFTVVLGIALPEGPLGLGWAAWI
ncbi:MAG: tripartite tricarboxylate transporter TctB family protein, partial [Actinomycetia bacterium]|nr:tripartite tricarboxylate transporter TctB family protein [Actinomycetes bacterium]